jgi:hypothetical protein
LLYKEKFAQIGSGLPAACCNDFFDREPLNNIANDMGYTEDYVKKKNKVCKGKLMELIQTDPRFKELSSDVNTAKTKTAAHG